MTGPDRTRRALAPVCRADRDKPHRCPACWSVVVRGTRPRGWWRKLRHWNWRLSALDWRVYACQECGQRFTGRPFARRFEGATR